MTDILFEKSSLSGSVDLPASKSYAHRFLISSALDTGSTEIRGVPDSDDVCATLGCLESLGVRTVKNSDTVTVTGRDPSRFGDAILDCRESGSTLRLLIPICMLSGGTRKFNLRGSLCGRPLGIYEDIASKNGIIFEKQGGTLTVGGGLESGEYAVDGDISSQFISGLLMALPLCDGDSTLYVKEPFESRSYVDMTLDVLEKFSVRIIRDGGNRFVIPGKQKYRSKAPSFYIEPDYTAAAYIGVFNYAGGDVRLSGLSGDTVQGDAVYRDYFEKTANGSPTLDVSDCPDLAPVLMALGAIRNGVTLIGTRRLEFKESDRGRKMAGELAKFGVKADVFDNRIEVLRSVPHRPEKPVLSHSDHRLAMALALPLSVTGGILCGAEAVNKSYPDYFDVLRTLGADIKAV